MRESGRCKERYPDVSASVLWGNSERATGRTIVEMETAQSSERCDSRAQCAVAALEREVARSTE